MNPNPNPSCFPIFCYLLNNLDPYTYSPLPTKLHQSLLTHFPHLNHPNVLLSLTQCFSQLNTTHTLSLLCTLDPCLNLFAIAASRAKISEPHMLENKTHMYQTLVRVEEMHQEGVKQLKVVEERLVEVYRSCVTQSMDEKVNEQVVGILKKTKSEEMERVDLFRSQLQILPEVFGRCLGEIYWNHQAT